MTIETVPIRVRRGDNLTRIVRAHGFPDRDWRRIYNASYNRAFRRRNPDPNVVQPGEDFRIPRSSPRRLRDLRQKIDRTETTLRNLRRELGTFRDLLNSTARDLSGREARNRQRQDRIDALDRRAEWLEGLADDAAGECSDTWSCMGGGAASSRFARESQQLRREIRRLRGQTEAIDRSTLTALQRRVDAIESDIDSHSARLQRLSRDMRRTESELYR